MAKILGLGWLATNASRNYPLSQEGNFAPVGGEVGALPDDLILDMQLSVPYGPGIYPFNFYLKTVSGYSHGAIVEIGYYNSDYSSEKATVAVSEAIPASTHSNAQSYTLFGSAVNTDYDFSSVVGTVTIGNLDGFSQEAPGRLDFSEDAYIETTVVALNSVGVSSIRAGTSLEDSGDELVGHVVLVPRLNTAIQTDSASNAVIFNALDGAGLSSSCSCEGEISLGDCIRTIEGVQPTSAGNINLTSGPCIGIDSDSSNHSVTISETCSSPCCGCEQLDVIVADLRELDQGFKQMDTFLNALAGQVGTITASAFASVVTNDGCGDSPPPAP